MTALLAELRRRNVFRVAAGYLVAAWLVMQVVVTIADAAGLPGWADSFVLILLIAAFPVVLFIAWAFELTPEGVKRSTPADAEAGARPLGVGDYVLVGLMVLVLAITGFQVFTRGPAPADPAAVEDAPVVQDETQTAPVVEASIAVLPFADLSPEGDQQYFSDGVAEELLNALAQFPDLKVAARTSAFSFREATDLRQVGETLGVAHVLEGSVRRSGDRLRITAQLIRASDGFHLWSQTYDRTLTDVFEIQDEIVGELSRVLQVRLGVGAGEGRAAAGDIDPRAYEQYLRGLSLWADRIDIGNRWDAVQSFRRATEIDSGFADAWASYGFALIGSNFRDRGMPASVAQARGFEALNRALEIEPDSARAHTGLAGYYSSAELDMARALDHGRRAMALAPNAAHSNYVGGMVMFRAGDIDGALIAFDRALAIDALNAYPVQIFLIYSASAGREGAVRARCRSCDDFDRTHFIRRVVTHNGSEAEVRAALDERVGLLRSLAEDSPELEADIEDQARLLTDLTEVLLGVEGAGAYFSAELDLESADIEDAAVLAHLGEDERAIEVLYRSYRRFNTLAPELEYILTAGRYEFPERTRRHPRYHEYWSQPGMAEWAEIRRANGATAGLPLPMDGGE